VPIWTSLIQPHMLLEGAQGQGRYVGTGGCRAAVAILEVGAGL